MSGQTTPWLRQVATLGGVATLVATLAGPAVWWVVVTPVEAQLAADRLAGLEWTFVRIRYSSWNTEAFRARYWSEPWAIDGPAAEQNLSRRVKSVTAIQVNDPIVLTLEDPELWKHPWIYFVEPGNLRLTDAEVPVLREFLLRGGTATLDDFHGAFEWANVEEELARVFPDRKITELHPSHPLFSSF